MTASERTRVRRDPVVLCTAKLATRGLASEGGAQPIATELAIATELISPPPNKIVEARSGYGWVLAQEEGSLDTWSRRSTPSRARGKRRGWHESSFQQVWGREAH